MKTTIALADDHQLFIKSLALLINNFPDFTVVLEALNGKDLVNRLATLHELPEIALIDVNMPQMDGWQTTKMISEKYPTIKIVALSMKSDDLSIINMLKAGCCSYLLKEIHPDELERALVMIASTGYYNADAANVNFRRLLKRGGLDNKPAITDREKEFLQLASTDLTYDQIAREMKVSLRTVDGYRESLFAKLKVQSRVGMVMEALKLNIISLK